MSWTKLNGAWGAEFKLKSRASLTRVISIGSWMLGSGQAKFFYRSNTSHVWPTSTINNEATNFIVDTATRVKHIFTLWFIFQSLKDCTNLDVNDSRCQIFFIFVELSKFRLHYPLHFLSPHLEFKFRKFFRHASTKY